LAVRADNPEIVKNPPLERTRVLPGVVFSAGLMAPGTFSRSISVLHMTATDNCKRTMYAVVYFDEQGNEKSIWYPTKRRAEEAKDRLGRKCRVVAVSI
jgi:hypothetical protein